MEANHARWLCRPDPTRPNPNAADPAASHCSDSMALVHIYILLCDVCEIPEGAPFVVCMQ